MNDVLGAEPPTDAGVRVLPVARRLGAAVRGRVDRLALAAGAPFFFVACVFAYYGQLSRAQPGDAYGTIYTAVAIVKEQTIWLDKYFPILQQHAGLNPGMVTQGPGGHLVNLAPSAASLLAVPVVAIFSLFGVKPEDFGAWMEAGMLTAALASAACVAVMFVLLSRLTTRKRAVLVTATFAWGSIEWGINGQALWQHTGAALALTVALLAFVDRRLALAGAATAAMVAFRPNTAVLAPLLLPLVGRRLSGWGRFLIGIAPFALPLLAYNTIAFGSPFHQGYGSSHIRDALTFSWGSIARGTAGLLFSPGIGLFVFSPVFLFAIVGAIRGLKTPLYRWCLLGTVLYTVVSANAVDWYGGENFGPRRLADILPLLAVLLVPAVDAIVGTRWLWAYLGLLALSVFVELLGAAAWPASRWFDTHPDLKQTSVWWHPLDNQLTTKLVSSGLPLRLGEMVGLLLLGMAFGVLANRMFADLGRSGRR